MKNILAFLIVGLGFFCSCESRDGDWDSMVWESNDVSNINKNKNIEVPQAGNTYVFTCKNYKNFWVYAIQENGKQIGDTQLSIDCKKYEDNNISISIEKNKMNVTFFPNEEYQIRNISIGITAGDIFNSFFFKQKGKDN